MATNPLGLRRGGNSDNWFTLHPVSTISVLLAISLLLCLLIFELFLRTFSGLGNPPLYEISPLYGYRLKPSQVIEPRGGMGFLYGARVTTNNLGLRAAGEWDSNPAGKILFMGDSVTYGGQYIADTQLFSSVAASRLQGWQVGNGANNAWGIENIVGLIKDYDFSPAGVVVTCVIEGDFYRGLTRAMSMPLWTERPVFALQDLIMHLTWRVNRSRYDNWVDQLTNNKDHLDKIVDRAARHLKDLDDYLKRKQIEHFIFILPTRSQVVDGEPPDNLVEQMLQKYEINAEYLLPKLLPLEQDLKKRRKWFHDEAHLEVSGHQTYGILIGDALANALSNN